MRSNHVPPFKTRQHEAAPQSPLATATIPYLDSAGQRNQLRRQMEEARRSAMPGDASQSCGCVFAGLGSARAQERARATSSDAVRKFYEIQLHDRTNAALFAGNPRAAAQLQQPEDAAMLRRAASFLSISPQASGIGALMRLSRSGAGPRLDDQSRDILQDVLRTVKFNAEKVQLNAIEDARMGRRVLPLSLDFSRFQQFLAARDPQFQAMVHACRDPSTAAQRLVPLLERFATEYLQENGRLPSGIRIPPALQGPLERRFADALVKPVTVDFSGSLGGSQEKSYNKIGNQDQVCISLRESILNGPLDNYGTRLERFQSHSEPQQRAALALQLLVGALTTMEETVAADALHLQTASQRREALGTSNELDYRGSQQAGDGCGPGWGARSQRGVGLRFVEGLPQIAQIYERRHQEPLLTDPALKRWISAPGFADSVRAMLSPATRLRLAQGKTTAEMLLHTNAFRLGA